jgi:alpha-L-fucosidase
VASTKELTLKLPRGAKFNVIRLREDIRYGQRIDEAVLERGDGVWEEIGKITSIGPRRVLRSEVPTSGAEQLRLKVTKSSAPPRLAEFTVFQEPA